MNEQGVPTIAYNQDPATIEAQGLLTTQVADLFDGYVAGRLGSPGVTVVSERSVFVDGEFRHEPIEPFLVFSEQVPHPGSPGQSRQRSFHLTRTQDSTGATVYGYKEIGRGFSVSDGSRGADLYEWSDAKGVDAVSYTEGTESASERREPLDADGIGKLREEIVSKFGGQERRGFGARLAVAARNLGSRAIRLFGGK